MGQTLSTNTASKQRESTPICLIKLLVQFHDKLWHGKENFFSLSRIETNYIIIDIAVLVAWILLGVIEDRRKYSTFARHAYILTILQAASACMVCIGYNIQHFNIRGYNRNRLEFLWEKLPVKDLFESFNQIGSEKLQVPMCNFSYVKGILEALKYICKMHGVIAENYYGKGAFQSIEERDLTEYYQEDLNKNVNAEGKVSFDSIDDLAGRGVKWLLNMSRIFNNLENRPRKTLRKRSKSYPGAKKSTFEQARRQSEKQAGEEIPATRIQEDQIDRTLQPSSQINLRTPSDSLKPTSERSQLGSITYSKTVKSEHFPVMKELDQIVATASEAEVQDITVEQSAVDRSQTSPIMWPTEQSDEQEVENSTLSKCFQGQRTDSLRLLGKRPQPSCTEQSKRPKLDTVLAADVGCSSSMGKHCGGKDFAASTTCAVEKGENQSSKPSCSSNSGRPNQTTTELSISQNEELKILNQSLNLSVHNLQSENLPKIDFKLKNSENLRFGSRAYELEKRREIFVIEADRTEHTFSHISVQERPKKDMKFPLPPEILLLFQMLQSIEELQTRIMRGHRSDVETIFDLLYRFLEVLRSASHWKQQLANEFSITLSSLLPGLRPLHELPEIDCLAHLIKSTRLLLPEKSTRLLPERLESSSSSVQDDSGSGNTLSSDSTEETSTTNTSVEDSYNTADRFVPRSRQSKNASSSTISSLSEFSENDSPPKQ